MIFFSGTFISKVFFKKRSFFLGCRASEKGRYWPNAHQMHRDRNEKYRKCCWQLKRDILRIKAAQKLRMWDDAWRMLYFNCIQIAYCSQKTNWSNGVKRSPHPVKSEAKTETKTRYHKDARGKQKARMKSDMKSGYTVNWKHFGWLANIRDLNCMARWWE